MIETNVKCDAPSYYNTCTSTISIAEIAGNDWWELQLDGDRLTIKRIVTRDDVHAEAQHACSWFDARKLAVKLTEEMISETIEVKSNE